MYELHVQHCKYLLTMHRRRLVLLGARTNEVTELFTITNMKHVGLESSESCEMVTLTLLLVAVFSKGKKLVIVYLLSSFPIEETHSCTVTVMILLYSTKYSTNIRADHLVQKYREASRPIHISKKLTTIIAVNIYSPYVTSSSPQC